MRIERIKISSTDTNIIIPRLCLVDLDVNDNLDGELIIELKNILLERHNAIRCNNQDPYEIILPKITDFDNQKGKTIIFILVFITDVIYLQRFLNDMPNDPFLLKGHSRQNAIIPEYFLCAKGNLYFDSIQNPFEIQVNDHYDSCRNLLSFKIKSNQDF